MLILPTKVVPLTLEKLLRIYTRNKLFETSGAAW